jgi:hypothetical protein
VQKLAASANCATTGTETVCRPEPGLARGLWEAPAWAFYALALAVFGAASLYAARRLGVLKLRRR